MSMNTIELRTYNKLLDRLSSAEVRGAPDSVESYAKALESLATAVYYKNKAYHVKLEK